jgi:hypothetical protein
MQTLLSNLFIVVALTHQLNKMKMKTLFALILVVLSTQLSAQATWHTFENDRITIAFPKNPKTTTQAVPTAIGNIDMNIASYDASKNGDGNFAFVFISSVYPDSLINSNKKELLQGFFRNSIDGAVNNVGGKLISETEVELNGFPGREVKIDYGNGLAIIFLHLYLVKNNVYFVQTITQKEKEGNADVLRFHQSFKLKN